MTHDQLKQMGRKLMEVAIRELPSPTQAFHLVGKDGKIEVVLLGGEMTNSGKCKDIVSDYIRQRIKMDGVQAVLMVSDTYAVVMDRKDQVAIRRAQRAIKMGLSVLQGEALGIWKKGEAIAVTCESIDGLAYFLKQPYLRDPADQSKTILEDLEEYYEAAPCESRFTGLFAATRSRVEST